MTMGLTMSSFAMNKSPIQKAAEAGTYFRRGELQPDRKHVNPNGIDVHAWS